MRIVAAYVALGFLIGNLVGLTAESVTASLLALLFAFGGGSAVAFMQKLDAAAQDRASKAVLSLSVACLLGVYAGVFVSENQLLSPRRELAIQQRTTVAARKYLRNVVIPSAHLTDQKYQSGQISAEQAYEELYALITED